MRLINVAPMLEQLDLEHYDKDWYVSQYNADWIYSWLESQTVIDAEPVKHGRWINRTKSVKGLWDYRFDCSTCGHIFWNAGIKNFNYCPACGAKMDLEGNNG